MNKPELKTVLTVIDKQDELIEDFNWLDLSDYLKEEQLITFTPEEYNNHIKDIIKETLDNAADKAETKIEESYAGSLGNENGELYDKIQVINKESITNTLEDTFNKLKYE